MFYEIKKAACEFWNKIEQKYILTDEYFNNLSSFNDTVMNFFKHYQTYNSKNEAIVYLVGANQKLRDLHKLQMENITLDDKKNKMKENENDNAIEKFRKKTLDFDLIGVALPGLDQY